MVRSADVKMEEDLFENGADDLSKPITTIEVVDLMSSELVELT